MEPTRAQKSSATSQRNSSKNYNNQKIYINTTPLTNTQRPMTISRAGKTNESAYSREHLRAFVLGNHHRSRRREYSRSRRCHRIDFSPHGILPKALVRCNRRDDTEKGSIQTCRKLRIIVLFHSLFNMLNKRVARQAMSQAKQLGVIPSEAYANQGFRAVDCGLNKVLTADILQQNHTPAALCSNDAKQCYDRIVHSVAYIYICLQRIGIVENTCRGMFGSLQQIQHSPHVHDSDVMAILVAVCGCF
jgi:hypothetical protein